MPDAYPGSIKFEDDVRLDELDIDGKIGIRPAGKSTGVARFHIDEDCSHSSDDSTQKDPSTQFNDLLLCKVCRYNNRIRMEGFVVSGGD